MLNEKEKKVLAAIQMYIKKNNISPTIRELCEILNYKSTKTIYKYLNSLKKKNFLSYQNNKKRSIIVNHYIKRQIMVINTKKMIDINIDNNTILYQIKNSFFTEYAINKNDYLIINTNIEIKNNELGLFLINNKYRIMKYTYIDGYYILEDNEREILYEIKIIGKVVGVYRNNLKEKREKLSF